MRYADAVTSADRHTIYKNGVKEIAFLTACRRPSWPSRPRRTSAARATSTRASSTHRAARARSSTATRRPTSFVTTSADARGRIRELALLIAPTVNSYKRYATESWAPTSIAWGRDNRTAGFRIVGHGQSRRVECRIPGADVNPYLGYAALLAAGLDGIANQTDPGPELIGNAYEAGEAEPFPSTLREAVDLWERSEFARTAFGDARLGPLLELRTHRAAAVRPGRDGLRAPPYVRARMIQVIEPATEAVLAELPQRRDRACRRGAVERAREAFPGWRAMPPGGPSFAAVCARRRARGPAGRAGSARGAQRR